MICLYFRLYFIYTIRCTTLLPPFFFRNSRLYCKKLVIWFILWFKVLSIAGYRIFSYSMQIITEVTMPCEHLRYAIVPSPPPPSPVCPINEAKEDGLQGPFVGSLFELVSLYASWSLGLSLPSPQTDDPHLGVHFHQGIRY